VRAGSLELAVGGLCSSIALRPGRGPGRPGPGEGRHRCRPNGHSLARRHRPQGDGPLAKARRLREWCVAMAPIS